MDQVATPTQMVIQMIGKVWEGSPEEMRRRGEVVLLHLGAATAAIGLRLQSGDEDPMVLAHYAMLVGSTMRSSPAKWAAKPRSGAQTCDRNQNHDLLEQHLDIQIGVAKTHSLRPAF